MDTNNEIQTLDNFHPVNSLKFLIYTIQSIPKWYSESAERLEFFELFARQNENLY